MGAGIDELMPFRWPAEWEHHARTWIAWPHERSDWPGKYAAIPWVYAEIVRHLALSEPVGILVDDATTEKRAKSILKKAQVELKQVSFFNVPTDRVWTRDSGPIFVQAKDGEQVGLDWSFNAWAKYDNHLKDNEVPKQLAKRLRFRRIEPKHKGRRVVLEGGAIDGNGADLLLTTEECLLSKVQERNPGLTREDYERVFANYFGVKKVIWLNGGIAGDDTHGHIDDLARFVASNTIVTAFESNERDENYRPLQENLDRLRGATDRAGKKLDVVKLPMPDPVYFAGRRLPASYANFYIANERVLVPTFNAPQDRVALGILAELFSGRKVIGIHAVDLVWGLGTLHCLTQQQPA
jgi:agmatine deiminase